MNKETPSLYVMKSMNIQILVIGIVLPRTNTLDSLWKKKTRKTMKYLMLTILGGVMNRKNKSIIEIFFINYIIILIK